MTHPTGQIRVGTGSGPESGVKAGPGQPATRAGPDLGHEQGNPVSALVQAALPDIWLKPWPSPCAGPISGPGPVRDLTPGLGPGPTLP